jgi:hypothetical protein
MDPLNKNMTMDRNIAFTFTMDNKVRDRAHNVSKMWTGTWPSPLPWTTRRGNAKSSQCIQKVDTYIAFNFTMDNKVREC